MEAVAIYSGKLSAKGKHIKHSKTQKGEVFRTQALVLGELGSRRCETLFKAEQLRQPKQREERQSFPQPTISRKIDERPK